MRNNFLNLVAKMPQNTGGGCSRTKNRSVTVNLSSATTTNREKTERRPREDRETFVLRSSLLGTLKYVACLLLALVLGVGQMWGDTFTAAEIAAKSGDVNVGTTKNHLTVSSPGVTSVTNAKYAKISGSEVKRDGVEINGAATSGSLVETNVLSIKTDRGYKLVSPVKVNGHSSSTTEVKAAYVGWEGQPTNTFTLCNGATDWKFQKNSATTEPADNEITFSTTIRSIYIYKQIKTATDAYNSFGTSKTVGNNTKFYIASVTASAVLAPEIEGESQMFNDETITLVGYPAGGTWGVKAGDPGTITADGKLTATGNGTIHVTYTVDAVEGTKDIVAGTTKNLTWEFNTKDVLPTTAGITAVNVNGTFETAGQLKLDNGAYVAIDLTSKDYIITAASINARTGSDSKLINFGSALSTTADGNVNSSSSYADIAITPVKSSSIFSLSKNNSGVYVAKITLTVKKAVTHTLSYAVDPEGKATVVLSATSVAEGGTATATYSGIDGAYELDEWQISGTGASIDNAKANPVTVTMGTDNAVVTLKLKLATTKYDVTAATGLAGGSVVASAATEAEGETVTITATPAFRYLFSAWDVYKTDDPTTKVTVTETAGVYTFEMPNYPVTVSATFTEDSRKQILYLTTAATGSDKLYAALNAEATYNVIVEAPASQTLTNYDLVVLHESIDGKSAAASDNTNKKQVILDIPTTTIPVLNTKSYFYTNSGTKRWDWGAPNNGAAAQKVATLNTSYSNIADHPIFDGVTITANTVKVLTDDVTSGNTMQPIGTFTTGKEGYTLATTPNNGDGNGDGCAIHELTPAQRGASAGKYLMISVSNAGLNNLTADGQKLFKNAAAYLMSATAWAPAAAADDDATLKALSVSGLTLSPTFDAATVDYTVTKAYGAADPVEGDVTATPTADGAKAEVEWDDTNKKFTITVTAVDNTTKKEYTITVNEATAPKSLSRVLFSNGFDAFIDNTNHTVKAFYLSGTAEPTATTITAGEGTAGELSEGKIRVTGEDASYVDYIVTLEAVTPNTTTVAAEAEAGAFDGTEAWVKNGLLISENANGFNADGKYYVNRRLLKSGDAADDQRVIAGWVRSYFFVGNAYKFIMTVSNNNAIYYSIDGGEQVASNAATVEITLPAGNHMIEIVSNQSNGDCRLSAPKLVERPATYTVTYTAGEGTGDDVVDAFEYAAGDEVTVQANAFTAPANKKFNGWASAPAVTISEGKFEMPASNVVLTAQWKEYFTITYKDGEATIGTEDVFTDATPAGIAYPSKVGYDFAGWVDGEDSPVTIASLSATTTVYAKWTAFDGCVELWPATSGEAPTAANEEIVLQSGSKGGTIVTISAKNNKFNESFEYTANGFGLKKGGDDVIGVTLNNEIAVGTKISVTLYSNDDGARGLILQTAAGEKVGSGVTLGWADATIGAVETFTYTAEAGDGLVGTNGFRLKRSNTVFLQTIKVTNCGDAIVYHNVTSAVDPEGKGTVTLGASSVREGRTTTAEYSAIDPLYEFVNWTVSGAGASVADATANPATITVGTEDAVVTLNLRLIPVKFTVNYYDGETLMGTEKVAVNESPTASEIVKAKRGYVFEGWATSSTATASEVINLNTITSDVATTIPLYAVYTAVPCPTSGTVYKFQLKSGLTDGNMATSVPTDIAMTTENYLSNLTGGFLTVAARGNVNRIKIVDGNAIGFANGDDAYLKMELECEIKAGDVIKYNISSNDVILMAGSENESTNKMTLSKNATQVVVDSKLVGAVDLYMKRSSSSPKITYFEIYRPAKYDVSFNMMGHGSAISDLENVLEGSKITAPTAPTDADYSFAGWYKENTLENAWDFNADVVEANTTLYAKWLDKSDATLKSLKYGTTEIELQAGVYTYAVELPSLTSSVPALTAVTNNPNAGAIVTDDDAFDGTGHASSTVEVTPEKEGAAHQTYTVNFTKLPSMPLLDVDNSIVWDFANAGTQNNTFTDEVLANFPSVTNNATFRAQTLKASGAKIKDGYLQGTPVLFHATKAGLLRVEFANTGGGTRPYRYLVINGVRTAYKSNNTAHVTTAWIEVPAGDVTIEGECVEDANGACTSNNLNFYKIEFLAVGHERAGLVVGDLGTVCLPNASIARGVTVYEYQGADAIGKIVFDELGANELLEAGKPYIFQVNETNARFFYTTDAAVGSPDNSKALKGNLGDAITFQPGSTEAAHVYFVKDHAFWMAKNTGVKIGQYRCYLQMDEVQPVSSPNPAPGRRRIVLGVQGEQVATGIDELNASEAPIKVMIDGQLFIIRGEKMYNANGQLVK